MNIPGYSSNEIIKVGEDHKGEAGLPKSTLWNFIKEILIQNQVKGEKNIYPLLDKISLTYINYLSSLGFQICSKNGKKTLNIEHILEALKTMNFNKHIKLLTNELSIKELENDEIEEKELEIKYEDNMNVKQLINRKKKSNKRKRAYENKEDLEELAREQREMFEQARLEQMNEQMNEHIIQNQIKENDIPESDNNNNSAPQNIDELLKNSEKDEINFD
jgi:hypothetical protein